jgi:hypothetical protein
MQAMSILIGFAHEGRRGDHSGVTCRACEFIVEVERVIVTDGEGEIANRGASYFLRRGISELTADPPFEFVSQQGADRQPS